MHLANAIFEWIDPTYNRAAATQLLAIYRRSTTNDITPISPLRRDYHTEIVRETGSSSGHRELRRCTVLLVDDGGDAERVANAYWHRRDRRLRSHLDDFAEPFDCGWRRVGVSAFDELDGGSPVVLLDGLVDLAPDRERRRARWGAATSAAARSFGT
jgi:hypothetical protein